MFYVLALIQNLNQNSTDQNNLIGCPAANHSECTRDAEGVWYIPTAGMHLHYLVLSMEIEMHQQRNLHCFDLVAHCYALNIKLDSAAALKLQTNCITGVLDKLLVLVL